MKKIFTVAVFFVLFTLCSYGQKKVIMQDNMHSISKVKILEDLHFSHGLIHYNHENPQSDLLTSKTKVYKLSDFKAAEAVKQRLDSVVEYGASDVPAFKLIFTYDSSGNNTQELYYTWDGDISIWVANYKFDFAYDANRNETQYTGYYWDNVVSAWVEEYKNTSNYDANSNKTQEIDYNWDISTNNWVSSVKFEKTYDSFSNMIKEISYNWDANALLWVGSWKLDYFFDTDSNLSQMISYQWDTFSNDWGDPWKSEYAYASNGNKTLEIQYYWNSSNSAWDTNNKNEYTYDSNGSITQELNYYWDFSTSAWIEGNKYKTDFAYDVNGNITQEHSYTWDAYTSTWVGGQKGGSDYTYDTYGNQTSVIYLEWDQTTSLYIPSEKQLNSYDLSYLIADLIVPVELMDDTTMINMILETSSYYWDAAGSNYTFEYNDIFYYNQVNPASAPKTDVSGIDIYPNPTSDYVKVTGFASLARFNLYNLQGKLILSKTLAANESVNVSGISAGVYPYNITVDRRQQSGMLIKK